MPKPVRPSPAAAAAFARSSATRQAHPESYTVILPQYLHMRPDKLRQRWKAQPSGDQKVVLFFNDQPPVEDNFIFSNWYHSPPFKFAIPEWCNAQWLTSLGLPAEVTVTEGEAALMLCKAALMKDARSFGLIIQARGPEEAKRLGKKVAGFDEPAVT